MTDKAIVSASKIQAVADAIRTKVGSSEGLTLDEMPKAIESLQGELNSESIMLAILEKTITECVSDKVTSVSDYAFYKQSNITKLRLPNVVTVGVSAFDTCQNIDQIDLPKCTKIGNRSFASCSGAKVVSLPLITDIPQLGLYGLGVKTANIPLVKTIGTQGIRYSRSLEKLDFLQLTSIVQLALENTNLTALIIRTNAVCSLGNTNALGNTPIAKGTGYVYVPSALVASYKSATNWTTYANQIRTIEDYPEVTGG